jgi:hypothetical protein
MSKSIFQRYEAATKRDTWWHCEYCGDHEPAEEPYVLGDSEPCSTCGEGVARVMTLRDGARTESEVARGIRQRRSAYT